MMIRYAAKRTTVLARQRAATAAFRGTVTSRSLVSGTGTAQKKRPLNVGQLKGEKAPPKAAAPVVKPDPPSAKAADAGSGAAVATPTGTAPTAAVASDGGGGGGMVLGLAVLGLGGVGAAYYYDVIDFESITGSPIKEEKKWEIINQAKEDAEEAKAMEGIAKAMEGIAKEEMAEATAASAEKETEGTAGKKEAKSMVETDGDATEAADAAVSPDGGAAESTGTGNRVTTIHVPPADAERPPQVLPTPEHPPNANRVTGLPFAASAIDATADESSKRDHALVSAEEAAKEIASSTEGETEAKLRAAHKSLRADLDEAYLADLDGLGERELRIRVVQLAAEMDERTKWEAVRLKEFLSMKEKETAEKYLEVLQKQRVEFEGLLARKLREQEDVLSRHANAAVQAKDESIQSVVNAAAEAQNAEHEAEIKSTTERIEREAKAKFEAELATALAEEKAKFASDMETRVAAMEQMAERLKSMEQALEVSRSFESGSIAAHKVSAAGLAFTAKAESSKSAVEELASLKAAAGEESVIGSALAKVPSSIKSGVPTLAELQAKFEKAYSTGRQAALVPEGRTGVGGQLFGMVFAKMTIPPSPESISEGEGAEDKSPEYVLARARRYTQLGDLESAVGELDKLEGEAGFVMRDWKQSAMDRISLDKATQVIKMECALLNKNMSGSS